MSTEAGNFVFLNFLFNFNTRFEILFDNSSFDSIFDFKILFKTNSHLTQIPVHLNDCCYLRLWCYYYCWCYFLHLTNLNLVATTFPAHHGLLYNTDCHRLSEQIHHLVNLRKNYQWTLRKNYYWMTKITWYQLPSTSWTAKALNMVNFGFSTHHKIAFTKSIATFITFCTKKSKMERISWKMLLESLN